MKMKVTLNDIERPNLTVAESNLSTNPKLYFNYLKDIYNDQRLEVELSKSVKMQG